MTLADIQSKISARFDYSGSTISSSSNEYARRTTLINEMARTWANELQGVWTPLLTTTPLSTTINQSYVTLPADFKGMRMLADLGGTIEIGSYPYQLVSKQEQLSLNSASYICWITGNAGAGFRLNIQPTPEAVTAFDFNYYSFNLATDSVGTSKEELGEDTDVTKCSDPQYLVLATIGELYLIDDEPSKAEEYMARAKQLMEQMVVNEVAGGIGQITTVPEYSEVSGLEPIGGIDNG